ncbi:MAG: hypothetical protein H6942_09410 [Candidatus Accumulibacter sp.]|uniref:hypothetical protein n=1 Tax=Accumulibacter sp. TaxID=2053492 RepID=UPI0019ED48EB|nr:hypothetical protein [Accumulibacter sp.]MBE2259573.1 hypothetical protein [Paracoccaceae bacterium]MCB1943807.1 hypothetical protein [Accumulibacter sp.]MCP5248730.1 hypothetical protein [Accumulibacter sp.]
MTSRPRRPGKTRPGHAPTAQAPTRQTNAADGKAPRQEQARWQRTVRYVWDKGGSKGGR